MPQNNTILIVDDEPSARDTLEAFLYPTGYELTFAYNGVEALELAEEIEPDLILLDVMMPDMDGFEVCQRLRQNPHLAEVHIIMITALDDRDSRIRGLSVGADEFISKPFDGVELEARVQTVMKLSRYRQLIAERTKFEWIVEQASEGYLLIDGPGHILYANNQARLFLGYVPDEDAEEATTIPETFLELAKRHYTLNPQGAWANWPTPLSEDAPSPRYMVRPESITSNVLWVQVDIIETATDGSDRYLIRLEDVTESIMTRNRIWTFDTQVSHKLKTPLAQLTGYLELVKYDVDRLTKEQIKADLSEAYDSAVRLRDRILDIFKYMESLQPPQPGLEHCRVSDIPSIASQVKTGLDIDSATVTIDTAVDPESTLLLTPQSIRLILWELFENAQKFHPHRAPAIAVDVTQIPGGACIRVIDDGIHLMPEQLGQIWLPYYQAEQRFTGEVPGMGLGLAVVSSLVWSVGGSCSARNREDQPGLVIEIALPLARA